MAKDFEATSAEPQEIAWRGIELCREGAWDEGLYWLGRATQGEPADSELPSQVFAYLGYGVARFQSQQEQGLRLCRHAVEVELYQAENHYYLARTWLLTSDRRAAIDALEKGLQIDSTNSELLELKRQLGNRRRPVVPFLPRSHILNRTLGKIRHSVLGGRSTQRGSSNPTVG